MKALRLLCFNLAVDESDPILAHGCVWAQELAQHCDQLDIITMYQGSYDLPANVNVFSVGKELGYTELRRGFNFYRYLFRLLRRNRYDAAFVHMNQVFGALAAPVLRLLGIPIYTWYAHSAVPLSLRFLAWFGTAFFSTSQAACAVRPDKVFGVGHGVNCGMFLPPESESMRDEGCIVVVGRISRIKQIDLVIEAMGEILWRSPSANPRLLIVGSPRGVADAPYAAELRELVARSGLSEVVSFRGAVGYLEMPRIFQRASIVISVCQTTSLDKNPLQGMACGTLPVGSPQYAEIFPAELRERFVVSRDSQSIAEKVSALLALPIEERQALRRKVRSIIELDHNLARLMERIVRTIREGVLPPR